MANVRELTGEGQKRLARSPAIEHWPASRDRWEAEQLLAHALKTDPDDLDPDAEVPVRVRERFRALIRRRAGGEPMPHILGWIEFRGLRLQIRPGAFVPRQSSEFLAEQAVRRLRARPGRPVYLDLATGMGPVALAVAHEVPRAEVHATDLLAEGLRQARSNARRLGLRNVTFHRGDLFAPVPRSLKGEIDVVTIHPPYVPKGELSDLPLEVRGFEPEGVLTDFSETGLLLVERTAEEGREWLRPGGWVLIEVSPDRTRHVKTVLRRNGYRDPRSTTGWPNVTRVVAARR